MVSAKASRVYTAVIIMMGIGALIPLIFIISSGRDSFINYILEHLRRPYLANILDQKIISPQKFSLIKYVAAALVFIDVMLVLLLQYYKAKAIGLFNFIFSSVYSAVKSLIIVFKTSGKKENMIFGIFLTLVIARGLYYVISTDLQYDEMWCYNYYTSRPFYLTFFSYANYPLYEFVTHIFKWLPFPMKINLRLPVLITGALTCSVIYACIKKITGDFMTAIACAGLFAFMPFGTIYMLYGKGSGIELFFAVISFFAVVFLLRNADPKKYFALFVMANVAGMYAMPTHIYFLALQFLMVFVFMGRDQKLLRRRFWVANLFVLMLSFFCYLPVMLGSGLSFVFYASFHNSSSDELAGVIQRNGGTNVYFTGIHYGLVLALLLIVFVLTICKKWKREYLFLFIAALLLYALPFAIFIIQGIYVPERAVAFMGFIVLFTGFLCFFVLKDFVRKYILSGVVFLLFIAACFASHFHPSRFWSAPSDKNAIAISDLLMKHHVVSCYDNAPASYFFYYYPALEYYYNERKMNIDIYMAAQNSLRYKAFSPLDNYDCIIDSIPAKNNLYLPGYEIVYANADQRFEILLRKGK